MNPRKKKYILIMLLCIMWILLIMLILGGKLLFDEYFGMLTMVASISCVIGNILIWFELRFRIRLDEYNFQHVEYKKERADIEEKILELQKMINCNDTLWQDNHHLLISAVNQQANNTERERIGFEREFGIDYNKAVNNQQVFMLMPFNQQAYKIYEHCLILTKKLGLKLIKSDDYIIEGDLLKHIIKNIVESEFIIANIDGKNPNVFYELGIAHSLGKKTILISNYKPEEIPFNIKNRYIIFYQNTEELVRKLEKSIIDIRKTSEENLFH